MPRKYIESGHLVPMNVGKKIEDLIVAARRPHIQGGEVVGHTCEVCGGYNRHEDHCFMPELIEFWES